jgi:glycosyltransferase involved in cell wall biosynthesis
MSTGPMRVAHLVDDLGIGGAERLVEVAARVLTPLGVELSVLSLHEAVRSPMVDALEALGVEIVWLPSQRKRSFLDSERLRRVRAALRAGDYDLVQTHLLYANVVGALAAHGAGIPVVATLHQTARSERTFERERELVESLALRRRVTRIVAVGTSVAEANRRRFGRVPIDIVSNPVSAPHPVTAGVRQATRAELLGDRAGPLVLSVGRVEPVKGFDDMITAFRAVASQQPQAVLAIAGDGSMRRPLELQARRAGLEGRVRLLGERSDVPALLAAADLFVMSSRSEGLPFALLEAMAAGLPIVATRVGDIPRALGTAGALVPPGEPAELAAAVTRALVSNDWRVEQSAKLSMRALSEYSEERWAADMMRVYRMAVEQRAVPRSLVVAVLTHGYKPRIGGIESQRSSTTPRLARLGIEPHVFTRAVPGAPRAEALDGVRVRRLTALPVASGPTGPGPLRSRLERPAGSLIWSAQCLWHLLRVRPDVIHADEVLSTSRVALTAGRLLGTPVVVFAHATGPIGDVQRNSRTYSGRRLLDRIRRRARLVVSVNDEIDEEFSRLGIEPERRMVLPNGVDVDRFAPATTRERKDLRERLGLGNEFVAVFTGRLASEKRLDRALGAWPAVTDVSPGAKLFIVGDGPEAGRLRDLAPAGIRFVGSTDDVLPYLQVADVFVLTSDLEGVSCALLEAQAVGLPAVVTDVGAARRIIDHGVNGYVVDIDDDASLREHLAALARDHNAVNTMGEAARRSAISHFSLDRVVSALRDLYVEAAIARDENPSDTVVVARHGDAMQESPCSS